MASTTSTAGSLGSSAPLGRSAIVAAVTAVVLIVVGFVLKALGSFEQPLSTALNHLHTGALGTLGSALYRGIGPAPAIVLTVVLTAVVLLVRRDLRVASTFAFTVAVTWLSVAVVKLLVDRMRPDATVMPSPYTPVQHDASYPSGHATFIAVIVIALIALAGPRLRPIATTVGVLVIAFACFLLVVDGVHFTSDVLASVCWALGVGPFVRSFWIRLVLPRAPFLTPRSVREQEAASLPSGSVGQRRR